MRTIEVDFDIHQAIEAERQSFAEPPNAALRRLLGLGERANPSEPNPGPKRGGSGSGPTPGAWRSKGLILAEGTALMLSYSEVRESGVVRAGKLAFHGEDYGSPSPAAMDVVQRHRGGDRVSINGWRHVYAQRNGDSEWRTLADLRPDPEDQ